MPSFSHRGCAQVGEPDVERRAVRQIPLAGRTPKKKARRRLTSSLAAVWLAPRLWRIGQRLCDTLGADAHPRPGWRNWQTQQTQNLPALVVMGVRPPLPAPNHSFVINDLRRSNLAVLTAVKLIDRSAN